MRRRHALALLVLAGCAAPKVGSISSAISYPNDQPAFDYFVGKGLQGFQAAGIVGNLDVESGVDPNSVESGGPGRGIAQWSAGARWDTTTDDNAVWYAGQQGESVYDLQLQLSFIWYELQTFPDYGFDALSSSTDVTDATLAFSTDFEGCGSCDHTARIDDAESVLAMYGNDPQDGGSVDPTGASCTVTTTGVTGECIDTMACAGMANHMSVAGYCPGAANIECCVSTVATMADGSTITPANDAGTMTAKKHAGGCSAVDDAPSTASASLAGLIVLWLVRRKRLA